MSAGGRAGSGGISKGGLAGSWGGSTGGLVGSWGTAGVVSGGREGKGGTYIPLDSTGCGIANDVPIGCADTMVISGLPLALFNNIDQRNSI